MDVKVNQYYKSPWKDARRICEGIEENGGGMVDTHVIQSAIEHGWRPMKMKIMYPDGTYVDDGGNHGS